MNTDEASAGSIFIAFSPSGTSVPAVAATNMLHDHRHAEHQPQHRVALGRPGDAGRDDAQRDAVAEADRALP